MKIKYIEEIIILMNKHNLKKIKIKDQNLLIEINKHKNNNITNTHIKKNINTNITVIKSPLVGIFYISPAPNKPDFVKKGDKIKKGDIVCIIEVMKTLHKIRSEYSGIITKIIAKNETPVEYNEDLFLINNV